MRKIEPTLKNHEPASHFLKESFPLEYLDDLNSMDSKTIFDLFSENDYQYTVVF